MGLSLSKHWKLLKPFVMPYRKRLFILWFFILINIFLQIYNPQIIRKYLDSVNNFASIEVLRDAALLFITIAIIQELIYIFNVYLSNDLAWRATNDMRFELMKHCVDLDMTFHNEYKPGMMIERVDGDVNSISTFFSVLSLIVFSNILLMVGVLIALFIENIIIGISFTILSIIAFIIMLKTRKIGIDDWKEVREVTSQKMGFIEERLSGTEEIKANDGVNFVLKEYHDYSTTLYNDLNTAVFKSSITHTVTIFFIAFGVTLVYVLGVPMVQNNSITPGTLFLFTYYFQLIMTPILEILRQIQIIQQADASVERINEIFDIEKILIDDGKLIANTGPVDIEFDNIKFSYNEDNYVLQNINFLLPAGKSMGLIGKTGSGKTTLSRLIYRLYDYEIGNILINGNSNKEYALEELRKMIVVVTQEVQLFKGTIRDNITFFNESIDDEQVINALNMVGLDVWLNEQEEGINTQLDKTGLSAGEEQLLALARSFIVNPSIVILDEASSRLDPATQTLIESAMDKLLENRTSLVIAHRLETLEKVDDILILENGEILEYGSRVVLTNNPNSHYSKLRRIGLKEMLA